MKALTKKKSSVKPTRRSSPATIYDVAQHAGLSIATVSRVLNAPDKVSAAARDQVMRAIDELEFVPKAEARARALQNSGRIGVLTPFFTAPSFVQRLRGVAAGLAVAQNELVIYPVNSQNRLEGYLASLPLTHALDGLIVMSLPLREEHIARLQEHQLETVLIEYPNPALNTVEIDDLAGGRLAATYLMEQGHRKLGFMGDTDLPEFTIHPVNQRLAGFRKGLEEAGIPLPPEYLCLAPYNQEEARQAAHNLLHRADRPTAIFVATDLQAVGVMRAAHEAGLRVPEDLAILGFDDLDMAEYMGLTTIRQHLDESGQIAVELLMARLANPNRAVQHVHLPLTVIKRKTA